MKVILVDDEYYALQGLRMELEKYEDIDVEALFQDPEEFLENVQRINPDVIFLDIEMPRLNGFGCAEKLLEMDLPAKLVFVTAFDQYAVRAFEINALDYLLKPIVPERLMKTLDRIRGHVKEKETMEVQFKCFKKFIMCVNETEREIPWRTKKAEELIAYLICEEGSFITKERIAEKLWPDLDIQKGLSNLYLTHFYVKKVEQEMGIRIPIESRRGKMRININEENCDLIKYKNIDVQMERVPEKEKLKRLEEGFTLYTGMLMEDRYYPWIIEYQQIYERRFVELSDELEKIYKKLGDAEKVEWCRRKVIDILG